MPSFTFALIIAMVFTAGGYLIIRAQHHAEAVGNCLFMVFVLTTLGTAATFAGQAMERHRYVPSAGREAMVQNAAVRDRAAGPPPRVWAQLDAATD